MSLFFNNRFNLNVDAAKLMSYRFTSRNFSKWQLALIIGTPLVMGFGIFVYRKALARPHAAKASKVLEGSKELEDSKELKVKTEIMVEANNFQQEEKMPEETVEELTSIEVTAKHKNEGNNRYRDGKFDEAIGFYDKAMETCPKSNRGDMAVIYQNRAAAYEMIKKWKNVQEDCNRALEFNPRYAKAYFRRAKAFEATNEMLKCLEDVTATCILEMFQNNNTIMYADRILQRTGREDAERSLKDRVPVLPSKSFIDTYLHSFVADPMQMMKIKKSWNKETQRGYVRAILALNKQKFDDIIPACTEEIESHITEAKYKTEALLMRGTFHLLSGNFDDAQADFDTIIDGVDVPATLRVSALIKRGCLHVQLDRKEMGLSDFEDAKKLQPENPDIYFQRAQILIILDNLHDALDEFEKAIKLAPQHAMGYVQKCYADYKLALMSEDQNRLVKVMGDFQDAIDKFPDCFECYSLMAQVLSDQQQYDQADEFYIRAIEKAPDNASLYVHRGILMLQWKGDMDSAVEFMKHAIEVDENCELAYETLGTIEVQRANLEKAVELFDKAIRLAKSQLEMCHLYALRNAAIAQMNVTQKLGIDMSVITALAQSQTNMATL